ncbi:MAG: c-type cytochrome [Brachymonas sp.]|nr:c-type cytochrome [Brachymonas sp.]
MRHPVFAPSWFACLVLALLATACSKDPEPQTKNQPAAPASASSTSSAVEPASAAASAQAAASQADATVSANALYQAVCAACHTDGVAGAPKLGNREDWQPRLAQGEAALMESVMNGKGSMPIKGTALDASEEELRDTVRYMVQGAQ